MTHEEFNALAPGYYWARVNGSKTIVQKFPGGKMHAIGDRLAVSPASLPGLEIIRPVEVPVDPLPPMRKAVIEVLVEAEDEGQACDALSESLRPLLKKYAPDSCIIDWRYSRLDIDAKSGDSWREHDGTGFELD